MNTIAQLWNDFSESDSHLATCNIEEKAAHKETFYSAILSFINMTNMELKDTTKEYAIEIVLSWAEELLGDNDDV